MSEARDLGALAEIVAAIDRILDYVAGLDEAAFRANGMVVDAVAMNLLVIGEAARRVDPGVLAREPGIPWSSVIALRNRIAHGYSSLQLEVIWAIVTRELFELRSAVERLSSS